MSAPAEMGDPENTAAGATQRWQFRGVKLGTISQTLGPLASLVASHHLGDPISAHDSLRPWKRRALTRVKLEQTRRRLAAAHLPTPDPSGTSRP